MKMENKENKKYETPIIDVIRFSEDIITTSGDDHWGDGGMDPDPDL